MASNNFTIMPLVEVGPQEEAGTLGAMPPQQFLPPYKNFADNEAVKLWCEQELWPVLMWCRQDRQTLQAEWTEIRNMVLMQHDAGRRYFGRSDSYLPVYKQNRKTLLGTLSKGVFPSDEYFDVIDRGSGDPEKAKPVKAYMQWDLETNARLRSFFKPFLASLVDTGTSVLKYWHKEELRTQGGVKALLAKVGGGQEAEMAFTPTLIHDGLAVSPRNLHNWFIYPSTCETIADASLVFEDMDFPYNYVQYMADSGRWKNGEEMIARFARVPEHDMSVSELLLARGSQNFPFGGMALSKMARQYTVTECWTLMVLPKEAYLPWEDSRLPVACRIAMAGTLVLEVTRNPFYHQQPPYVVGRLDWEAGSFYGTAVGRTLRPMQLLANDFVNQTNDNGIYALNPIVMMNTALMDGTPRPLEPGVAWYVTDVDKAVKFHHPPFEQVQVGMQMLQQQIGMAADAGGAPPVLQGTKGDKTATTTSILQKNALGPLQDIVEDIENDVMVPLLQGAWRNAVQYRDKSVMLSVAGEPISVDPADLCIDAHFRWMASSQAMNNQQRSQQALQLIQAIAPIVPQIVQQGYVVDFVALIKKVYVDGMGFRGFQDFIRKADAAPNAQMGVPARPEQLGGARAQQQDNLRSALEQVHGKANAPEMQPGEGDDFAQIRNETDDMAGSMGGMGGHGSGLGGIQ